MKDFSEKPADQLIAQLGDYLFYQQIVHLCQRNRGVRNTEKLRQSVDIADSLKLICVGNSQYHLAVAGGCEAVLVQEVEIIGSHPPATARWY